MEYSICYKNFLTQDFCKGIAMSNSDLNFAKAMEEILDNNEIYKKMYRSLIDRYAIIRLQTSIDDYEDLAVDELKSPREESNKLKGFENIYLYKVRDIPVIYIDLNAEFCYDCIILKLEDLHRLVENLDGCAFNLKLNTCYNPSYQKQEDSNHDYYSVKLKNE